MRNIAVIPARSGSKGLKDKNIMLLNGKPLIAYTIESAISSNMFDEIYVSTDSEHYAEISLSCGASVPFMRPQELASDTASSWEVVIDAIKQYRMTGKNFETASLLQPTSPLRLSQDICDAYEKLIQNEANAVVSVCETDHSPLWSNTLPEDGLMTKFIRREISQHPRQKLPKYYRINGAIYIVKTDYLLESSSNIFENMCYAFVMPKDRSVDIDDEIDFIIAGALQNHNKNTCLST